MYRLVEHRLHQPGNLHRVGEMELLRVLLQEGHNVGMGPLVGPPRRHADHHGLGGQAADGLAVAGGQRRVVGHLQNVAGGQGVVVPDGAVHVASQDDLPAVVVQPLAEAGDVHGLGPAHEVIAVPLPPEGRVVHRLLPGVQGGLAGEDLHGQVLRQRKRLHLVPGDLRKLPHPPRVVPEGRGVNIQAPEEVPRRAGQAVVPVGVQGAVPLRRDIGGNEPVHRRRLQHPAKAPDVVPVEVGGQEDVQAADALLFQKIPGVNPLGPGVQLPRVVVTDQIVVAAVHQHGKAPRTSFHLLHQNGIPVADVDEIQNQHQPFPLTFLFKIGYHSPGGLARKSLPPPPPKFQPYF